MTVIKREKDVAMIQPWPVVALFFGSLLVAGPASFGQTPDQKTPQSCVDVKIGSDRAYNCLNRELQRMVPGKRFSSQDAPYSATSPAPEVGTFNQAATRERLGSAFGNSVVPQRPPAPVFTPSLQRR
jgi:hypothetical protein